MTDVTNKWLESIDLNELFDDVPLIVSIESLIDCYNKHNNQNFIELKIKKGYDDDNLQVVGVRKLTEAELKSQERIKKTQEDRDLQLYLKLKQKFEPNV